MRLYKSFFTDDFNDRVTADVNKSTKNTMKVVNNMENCTDRE
ncbi:hypothetical protein [Oceanirhabdus seepicola]|nr:hypothetical protein [Oceanirhabdus seepicola]